MDIKNVEFYNKTMDTPLTDVCLKVVDIANYYMLYSIESSFNDTCMTQKGVDIILNIFSMILLYTKNIDMAVEYANNSIYYFIEYVSQISNKGSEFSFVNLTVKDAILYVYRKSIFEINENHKRTFEFDTSESMYFDAVNMFIKTYSMILKGFIGNSNYSTTSIDDIKTYIYKVNSCMITFFKMVDERTDVYHLEDDNILHEYKDAFNTTAYNGITSIYGTIYNPDEPSFSKTIPFDDKNGYDYMCERLKKIVDDNN
jgi:hypothetical protein